MTHPRTAWLAFAMLGVLDAVLLLEFPIAGLVLLVLAVAGMTWWPPRSAALAGLATGIGGTWTGLLLRATLSCAAFDAVPGQDCESPGVEGWIAIGAVILTIGALATIFVAWRARSPADD